MFQWVTALVVFVWMFVGLPAKQIYAVVDCTQDTKADQIVDWIATIGKEGVEKEKILLIRRAERLISCAKERAREAAKGTQKTDADIKRELGI